MLVSMALCIDDSLASIDWVQAKADLAADDFDNGRSAQALRRSFQQSQHVAIARDGRAGALACGAAPLRRCLNAYLLDVWTMSSYRRQGIASSMVRLAEQQVPGQHIGLQTDDAQALYESLGFVEAAGVLVVRRRFVARQQRKPLNPPVLDAIAGLWPCYCVENELRCRARPVGEATPGDPLVRLDVAVHGWPQRPAAGSGGGGGALSQSEPSRKSRMGCLSKLGGVAPGFHWSAGQKREESGVSTSSATTSSPSIRPELELGVGDDDPALRGPRSRRAGRCSMLMSRTELASSDPIRPTASSKEMLTS